MARPALALFELFFRPWMRRRLHRVLIAPPERPVPPGPLLLAANHVSWWDAFLLRELQRELRPRASLAFVMLQTELERRPFFRRLGGLGIDPERPVTVGRALREMERRRLADPELVVLFFPQGRIWPSHRRPLGFRSGVEVFARHLAPATVLPVALHLEPLTSPAPTAFVAAGEPLTADGLRARTLEAAVEERLDRIAAFVARHGEETPGRWPELAPPSHALRSWPVEGFR